MFVLLIGSFSLPGDYVEIIWYKDKFKGQQNRSGGQGDVKFKVLRLPVCDTEGCYNAVRSS